MKMNFNQYYYDAYCTDNDICVSWKQIAFDQDGQLIMSSGHVLDKDFHVTEYISPIGYGGSLNKLQEVIGHNPKTGELTIDIKWLASSSFSESIEEACIKLDTELRKELAQCVKPINIINSRLNVLSKYLS